MQMWVGKKVGQDPRTPGLAPHLDRMLGLALDLILGLGLAIGAMLLLSVALTKPANSADSAAQCATRASAVPDRENYAAARRPKVETNLREIGGDVLRVKLNKHDERDRASRVPRYS